MDHRTLNRLARELTGALHEVGLDVTVEPAEVRADGVGWLEIELDGKRMVVRAAARSDLRPVHAEELPTLAPAEAGVVFADRIAEHSRDVLRQRGWGWLDRRRGRLRLWSPGLRLDADITPTLPRSAVKGAVNPFSPAGMRLVLWLLTHPDDHASPRGLTRELGVSASQLSTLLSSLHADALLRKDRRPLVPELFWAMAEQWRPKRHPVVSLPSMTELVKAPELRADRWVMADTRAALAYGAPVVVSADYPPDLYVPDERTLSWLLSRAVRAEEWGHRVATVAVAPTPLVCDARLRFPGEPWPLAHPVVVALDLAADRSRGREILEDWQPDQELAVTRVW